MAARRSVRRGLDGVAAELAHVFGALGDLGDRLAALVAATPEPRVDDVASLRPPILGMLDEHGPLVAGAGLVTAPDLLADAPRWLEWWWSTGRGAPEPLRVNLDPAAPDFYDYTTTEWYATPQHTGAPHMAGPYVDYACTNEYAITLAAPVLAGDGLLGIAAADVLVSSIERYVLPALLGLERPTALTNAAGRVIASNSPALLPGQRLAVDAPGRARPATASAPIDTWLLVETSG